MGSVFAPYPAEVYSGEGMSLQDCQVARSVRNMMMALVLPRQRNLHDEIQSDMEDSNLIIQDNASAYSLREPSGVHAFSACGRSRRGCCA
jgi:hypothetical protein